MHEPIRWHTLRPLVVVKITAICIFLIMYLLPLALVPISIVRGAEIRYCLEPLSIVVYDSWIPTDALGATRGYVVYIRPDLYGEPMVLHHELQHVRQWWYSLGLCKYFYSWSTKYRMFYEYEAYVEGLRYSTDIERDLMAAAGGLSHPSYELKISPEVAYLLLENAINKQRGIE